MNDLTITTDDVEESEETSEASALSLKKSLRSAINQTCRDCIYDEYAKGEGNWRQQVAKCTVSKCGLYEVRPMSKPRKAEELPSEE